MKATNPVVRRVSRCPFWQMWFGALVRTVSAGHRWIQRVPFLFQRNPLLVHTLGLLAAAGLTWLVWRGYRQPGLLLDLANAMFLC